MTIVDINVTTEKNTSQFPLKQENRIKLCSYKWLQSQTIINQEENASINEINRRGNRSTIHLITT